MTEDEMAGWHHRLKGHELELTPGDGEGQGSLVCCSPLGHEESDTAKQQQKAIKQHQGTSILLQGLQIIS